MANEINIFGKLKSAARDKILADSTEIAYNDSNVKATLDENIDSLNELNESLTSVKADIEDLKLSGNTEQYIEGNKLDVNEQITPGNYKITNAKNPPVSDINGLLNVKKLSDTVGKQSWESENFFAFRNGNIIEKEEYKESSLLVNDVEHTETEVILNAGEAYELSGFFKGHIIVRAALDNADLANTIIKLNNVHIESDVESTLLYEPSNGKLILKVLSDKENFLSSYLDTPKSNVEAGAAILSNNNIEISGTGYLGVRTNWGDSHGIKGSKIKVYGKPFISVLSNHDGFHASSELIIENGTFIIDGGNASLEAKNSDGSKGNLHIYGGNFTLKNANYGISAGISCLVEGLDTKINFENIKTPVRYPDLTKVLETVETNTTLTKVSKTDWFGTANVRIGTENADGTYTDGDVIALSGDTYGFGTTGGILLVSGYIPNNINISGQSIDIILMNAFIETNTDKPSILYSPSKKKLGIKCYDGTSNYVIMNKTEKVDGNDYDAIKSESNLQISSGGYLYCKSSLGDAIDGSDVIIKGDGSRYFINSGERGIKGSLIQIGADGDDVTAGTAKNSDQNIYAYGNNLSLEYADIFARNGKLTKGTLEVFPQQKGNIYTETICTVVATGDGVNPTGDFYYKSATQTDEVNITDKIVISNLSVEVAGANKFEKDFTEEIDFPLSKNIIKTIDASWTIIEKTSDFITDDYLINYVNKNKVQIYESVDDANVAVNNLDFGTIVSVNEGASDDYNRDYNPYIVVRNNSGEKVLKRFTGGGGSTETGSVSLEVEAISINGVDQDLQQSPLECNIGDRIIFSYTFISQYYPDVKGTVYCKIGAELKNQEKVLPTPDATYTWTFDASSLSAGTYNFVIYGAESTGKQTSRSTFRIEVGGLSVESDFDEETILKANSDVSLPINVIAADTTSTIQAHVSVDNGEETLYDVKSGDNTLAIAGEKITAGEHSISVYLKNSKERESNKLTFSVIAAEAGITYLLTDKDEYTSSAGTRLDIIARAIELGKSDSQFTAKIVIKKKDGSIYALNGKEETVRTLVYGKNVVSFIGIPFDENDGTEEDKYTEYKMTFTLTSEGSENPAEKAITVKIVPNNYNIEPITDNLLCWFDAAGKSNQDSDRETWVDKSGNGVKATLNNFNWSSNGWLQDDSSTKDTALFLNSGSYVELDITPFADEPDEITISVDYSTKDILDSTAKVVSCLYEYDGTDTTTYYIRDAWGDYVKYDSRNNSTAIDTTFLDNDSSWFEDETNKTAAINYLLAFVETSNKETEQTRLEALSAEDLKDEYDTKKKSFLNNIIKYFIFAGGYCWIDGKTYQADGTTEYEVTYSPSERSINYNKGNENSSFDGKTELRKFTGTEDKTVTKQKGFYIDTQYGVLSNSSSRAAAEDKFHLNFSESTRTRMDLIITRKGETAPYYISSMIGYVNGVISSMQEITSNDIFKQESPENYKFKIYLGAKASYDKNGNIKVSDTGYAQIYSFRIYSKALSHTQVLYNYAADIPDQDKKKTVIDNNGIVNASSLASLPQLCLMGAKVNDKSTINDFIMQLANVDETQISSLKSIKKPAYVSYTDPDNTENNWVASDGTFNIPCRLQFQGTSSLVYPVKNYKFKMYESMDIDAQGNVTYSKAKLKKDIGTGIAESTFCIKVNYMDSSNVRNTGSANFISDYNQITGNTPAMELDPKIRTTIYGYPILLYYKEYPESTEQKFLGVGCLNLDKSDTDSFGLDEKVKDIDGTKCDFGKAYYIDDEFSQDILHKTKLSDGNYETISLFDNGDNIYKDYTTLRNKDNLLVAVVSEKGYIRTITNEGIPNVACFELKANSGASGAGGFGNYFIESVANDVEPRYPDDGDIEDDVYAPYVDSKPENQITFKEFKSPYFYHFQRLIKWVSSADKTEFVNNIDLHFNRNYLMDYYLTILLLGGVDSLGKNLMVGTWGPENGLYMTAEETLDSTNENYDKWAFKYELSDGSQICITPTRNKTTGDYAFAKDLDGNRLFYSEDCYSRYTKDFKSGHKSFDVVKTPGECIWYPMFYDIDTILGVDNSGQLLYDVDIELGDQLSDGTAVFNTADSHLWTKVKDYLGEKDSDGDSLLSDRWSVLTASKFTYENLVENFYYNRIMSKIPETYYNQDCFQKYVYEGPFKPGEVMQDGKTIAKVGSKSYLYCCHGSSYEHIKKWVKERIYYLNTMFGKLGNTNSSLRFNHSGFDSNYMDTDNFYANYASLAAKYPTIYRYDAENDALYNLATDIEIKPIEFQFKTYQPGYVGIRWFNGGKTHYERIARNSTSSIIGNVKTSGDAEVFIFGGENIKEIGDMSPYNAKQVDFKNLTKLNKLQLGSEEYKCTINKLDLGPNTYLSELKLTNCGSLTTVDVSECINMKTIDMSLSGITNIMLPPSGGALETITYSGSITNINLQNFTNLTTVITTNLDNLTSFVIKNCPKILGSKDAPNAKAWSLLQQTYNTASLTNIQITSYGTVDPKEIGSVQYFFPNKYYSYATAKNIKGEIYYSGKQIPSNYTKFADAFPYLTITYNNIEDVSEMFANYNNLNCIGTISVYTGTDIYGNESYKTVNYWVDATPELQAKWHNETMYSKYGVESTFTSTNKYYVKDSVHYRLIDIYDDADLDILRAEIKSHLSKFKKFTNLTGMFRNLAILDYIDPDTFNSIDISTATTDEMFSGCTNLKYFEIPGDTVKNNKKVLYYNYDEETGEYILTDIENWNEETGKSEIAEGVYINPFTEEETDQETSTYKKGMRTIGSKMFENCNKVKVFIHKYSGEKVFIDNTAFTYAIYDADKNATNYTLERPVILFENEKKELLQTTTDATTTVSETLTVNNEAVEGESNLYYKINSTSLLKLFNTQNAYIQLNDSKWLREVYFGVKSVVLNDTTTVSGATMDFATLSNGKKVIFKVSGDISEFNIGDNYSYTNPLNIYSETAGAFEGLTNLKNIEIPLPRVENLDSLQQLFNEEKSIVNIFTTKKYTLNTMKNLLMETLDTIYIVDTEEIPTYTFAYLDTIKHIGLSSDVKIIKTQAFAYCESLENIYFSNKMTEPSLRNEHLTEIEDEAFLQCKGLKAFNCPNTLQTLGVNAFNSCTNLASFTSTEKITIIPQGCFAGCSSLLYFSSISKNTTKIGDDAFYDCKQLIVINNANTKDESTGAITYYNGLGLVSSTETKNFDYFVALEYIGNNAFYNVNNISVGTTSSSRNTLLKFPSTLKYIGENAFGTSDGTQTGFTEIVWDGDVSTDFTQLYIGSNAFQNVRTSWRIDDSHEPIENCIFIPKLSSIGSGAFKLPGNNQFEYALAKNTEDEIGKDWVNKTKKIIFSYYGLFTDSSSTYNFFYLLSDDNKGDVEYEGCAYIQDMGQSMSTIEIPSKVVFGEKNFKVVEILSGAFDNSPDLMGIIFDSDSELELIESNVLKSTALSVIMTGTETNVIPSTLNIETGNELHGTTWFESLKSNEEYKGKFITLGTNIIGFVPNDDFNGNLDFTTHDEISSCTRIFDDAFSGMKELKSVKLKNDLEYIYTEAFMNTNLTEISFPETLKRIDSKAFFGCKFKELVFPASLESIGSSAFAEAEDKTKIAGTLSYVDFKDGASISGTPFEVQQDIKTNVQSGSQLPERANVSLKTIHVPVGMTNILSDSFSELRYLSQLRNIYLGTLELNDDPDDENYGTYLCKNYPLYTDSDGAVTFTETENPLLDESGNQIYCPRFYHKMAIQTKAFVNAYLETTEKYSVCPTGDYSGDINLMYIRKYSDYDALDGVDKTSIGDLTREELLLIVSGFTNDISVNISKITIRKSDWQKLTSSDILLIAQATKRITFTQVIA